MDHRRGRTVHRDAARDAHHPRVVCNLGRLEHIPRTTDHNIGHGRRVDVSPRRKTGQVHDCIASRYAFAERRDLPHVTANALEGHVVNATRAASSSEQASNSIAALHQTADDHRPDEAISARDEDAH
jgi:hypothetical protein